jgi:uncharacterized protein
MQITIPYPLGIIPAIINYPKTSKPSPAVVLVHGFGSYKEGDNNMLSTLANDLNTVGVITLQIDLCSCGANPADKIDYHFNRLVDEVGFCFNWLMNQPMVNPDKSGIIGISLGARVAVNATKLTACSRLVLLNGALGNKYRTPWFFKQRLFEMQEECRLNGVTTYTNSSGNTFKVYEVFFDALAESSTDDLLTNYHGDCLFVVGDSDPTVDHRVSVVAEALVEHGQLVVIAGADHTFNVKTPDQSKFIECRKNIISWWQKLDQE